MNGRYHLVSITPHEGKRSWALANRRFFLLFFIIFDYNKNNNCIIFGVVELALSRMRLYQIEENRCWDALTWHGMASVQIMSKIKLS